MTISQHHSRQNHDLTDKMLLDNDMGFPQCGDSNAWRRRYLLFRGVMRIDRLRVQSYLDTSLKSYPFIYGILKKKKKSSPELQSRDNRTYCWKTWIRFYSFNINVCIDQRKFVWSRWYSRFFLNIMIKGPSDTKKVIKRNKVEKETIFKTLQNEWLLIFLVLSSRRISPT